MTYQISDLEKIEPFDRFGKLVLIIFLQSEKQGIEADSIEFDHTKGTFTIETY